ncbi:MAG: hypothetical protein ACM3ZB_01320 [bacterium]
MDASAERFLAAIDRIDARLERAERELMTGKRINSPVDSPDDVSRLLVLRASLDRCLQTGLNLTRVKTEVDTAESALRSAVDVLDQIIKLGVQGATETQTVPDRKTIAEGVRAYFEQLVNLAGTAVGGRYLFSGDSDAVAPYTVDFTAPNGVSAYQGSGATRQVEHPAGTRFGVDMTADAIFDSPAASAFAAVNALRLALENGPDEDDPDHAAKYAAQTDAIAAALEEVRAARKVVAGSLATMGTTQVRVNEAVAYANQLEIRLRAELGYLADADVTESILDLSLASVHRLAALSARAKLPQGSLFDFLG